MKSWQKIINSGFFKEFLMFLPVVLFGSFSFAALKGLNNMIKSTESAVPKAYARYRSEIQARRKGKLQKMVGTQDALINNLQEYMKKPAELEAAKPEINEKCKASQETEKNNPPLTAFLSSLNSNPKAESRKSLANKFYEILSSTYFESAGSFDDSQPSGEDAQTSTIQVVEKRAETGYLKFSIPFGDPKEGLFPEHDKATILNDIYSKLFDPEYDQKKPKDMLGQINYRCSLISEARQILKSTKYSGLDILIDEIINHNVLAILQNKFNKGEKFSKLERIIADVASFYMGGYRSDGKVNSESDLLGNLVKNQPIKFTREIVDSIYNQLSFEEKYIRDKSGHLLKLDPVGVVRNALESSGYKLDGYWYSWGTKAPMEYIQDLDNLNDNGIQIKIRSLRNFLEAYAKNDKKARPFVLGFKFGDNILDSKLELFRKNVNELNSNKEILEFLAKTESNHELFLSKVLIDKNHNIKLFIDIQQLNMIKDIILSQKSIQNLQDINSEVYNDFKENYNKFTHDFLKDNIFDTVLNYFL